MAFKKGESGNKSGRPTGVKNKVTTEFKLALNDLLQNSAPRIQGWLDEVASDDPSKALDHLGKLAEFVHPKLARKELVGDKENPLDINVGLSLTDKEILDRYQKQTKEPKK